RATRQARTLEFADAPNYSKTLSSSCTRCPLLKCRVPRFAHRVERGPLDPIGRPVANWVPGLIEKHLHNSTSCHAFGGASRRFTYGLSQCWIGCSSLTLGNNHLSKPLHPPWAAYFLGV